MDNPGEEKLLNRRDFLKALAATSLLGLVAKFPEMEEELDLAELEEALAAVGDSAKSVVPCLREMGTSVQEAKHMLDMWEVLGTQVSVETGDVLCVLSPDGNHGWQEILVSSVLLDSDC